VVEGEVALSPEVKQLVADEVRRQIEHERAESQSAEAGYPSDDTPEWADNATHVFVGTIDTPLAGEAAPDVNAGAELNQAYRDTDQAEQAALVQAGTDTTAGTPTVSLGQTIDQVRAILGPPQEIMDAGPKQIYVCRTVKITFVNGRVSDIQ
jgi:hypothetical protein